MATDIKDVSVWKQTKTLLYKNYLVKCRTKNVSLQEILYPFLWWLVALVWVSVMKQSKSHEEMEAKVMGPLSKPVRSSLKVGYTPITNATEFIMDQVLSSKCFTRDFTFIQFEDEEKLKSETYTFNSAYIIFKDSMSYELTFYSDSKPISTSYTSSREDCDQGDCDSTSYYYTAFTALQACLDAAIIKLKTNYSVWDELKETPVVMMKEQAAVEVYTFQYALMAVFLVMAFSPFGYSVAVHVVAEKEKRLKEFMKTLGLHDTAFWLSWVVLYTALMLIISLLMAIITTSIYPFNNSNCYLIFMLYTMYGISLILFALMLTPLFKKSKQAGAVEFLITLIFGSLGLFILIKGDFPKSFVWFLSPFCHCTFMIGIAQVMQLEDFGGGAHFSNLKDGPYPLIITFIFLVVDSVMYLLLATYLDQVLPGEYGLRRPPLFFLKPSYWSKKSRNYQELSEVHVTGSSQSAVVEAMPSEFHGKEAIRINCLHKSFKKKNKQIEALQGFSCDMYEGQITALLGHSSTGKTTLLNILSGLCPPSNGIATIYGHRVTDMDEIQELRKVMGTCQQTDINFDVLTVEENLSIFASLRGIDNKTKEQEINKILYDLDMHAVKHNQVSKLSVGQKRKLSVAIAILGDPKVLLLDEPTAGMDSCSRYTVWNLLRNRKSNHVIVFSTHIMEEADILADRKAVISQGTLKCVGSSLFLKSKLGVGYCLSMDIETLCDVSRLTELIRTHIPGVCLTQQRETSVLYSLPLRDMDKFPGLFSALESNTDLGVITYGVSMTTLADVFFKLEVEAEIDQTDQGILSQQKVDDETKWKSMEEIEQSLLQLPETDACTVSGKSLWKQQAFTIAKLHFRNLFREAKSVRHVSFFFFLFLIIEVAVFFIVRYNRKIVSLIRLSPDVYFLHPGQTSYKYLTSLLVQNSTGTNIDDLLSAFNSQRIKVELINGSNYASVSPHNAALNVQGIGKNYTFEINFNRTMVYILPVLINTISNTLLRLYNVTDSINIWSNPFIQDTNDTSFRIYMFVLVTYLGMTSSGMLPYIAMQNAFNHKVKAYTQLKMAGLYPSAYWIGQAVVDMPFFFLILIVMSGSLLFFDSGISVSAVTCVCVMFCLIGYVPAVILLSYVASFTYKKITNTRQCWLLIFAIAALISITVTEVASIIGNNLIATVLHHLFCILVPLYPLVGCINCFIQMPWKASHVDGNNSDLLGKLLVSVVSPYIHCVILLFILRFLEIKNGGKSLRKDVIFSDRMKKNKVWKFTEAPDFEDEDVRAERARVGEYMAPEYNEKPAILVSGLHKEFDEKNKKILGKTMRKLVANNISFCVKKGEVLGLVGPNGAGKTALLNIMVGQTEPNAGQIQIYNSPASQLGCRPIKFIGYSPQINHLWPEIKVQEHLEIYGAIKGMKSSDLKEITRRIVNTLDLKEHLQKPAKKLSAGTVKKLSFALTMLGNPDIVLLDEPSTGMDTFGKQHLWRVIRSTFKGKEQAAVITTHYMDEAEAICDRVAIIVSGQLRYIGSVQHLKSKFGRHFSLDMKLETEAGIQKLELLHKEVLELFPNATRLESFASLLSYKVPKEDVRSLSESFSKLEQVKRAFNIEDYSFSQSTLEQVFLELAKEQEEEDNITTMNSTLWWERRLEDTVVF
ncbi:cholesterol transporter ABCA5 isoform X2 [Bombina bombina]|nr:cholesterol transporter ABCA5 isoform X2 [Bombina bombina]